jgi:hypothetical protein
MQNDNITTIDITPTWVNIMPLLLMGVKNGSKEASAEIMRLAAAMDEINNRNTTKE